MLSSSYRFEAAIADAFDELADCWTSDAALLPRFHEAGWRIGDDGNPYRDE